MINLCRVCSKPLKKYNSEAHSGECARIWHKAKSERVDPEFFKEQLQGGFAYDEISVLL
jgi:hypothetical protein